MSQDDANPHAVTPESAPDDAADVSQATEDELEEDDFDDEEEIPPPKERPTATRSLRAVRRAISRAQTRAVMLEHLARVVAIDFRGTECEPPRLLLRVPGGGAFAVERDDVTDLENDLLDLAADERSKIVRISGAGVAVDPADVDIDRHLRGSILRPPHDENPVDNPEHRRAAAAYSADSKAARTVG
jgi:hypothetical protein